MIRKSVSCVSAVFPLTKLIMLVTMVTLMDKKQNVKFYTEKCGFHIESTERDGNVELVRFAAERYAKTAADNRKVCQDPEQNYELSTNQKRRRYS